MVRVRVVFKQDLLQHRGFDLCSASKGIDLELHEGASGNNLLAGLVEKQSLSSEQSVRFWRILQRENWSFRPCSLLRDISVAPGDAFKNCVHVFAETLPRNHDISVENDHVLLFFKTDDSEQRVTGFGLFDKHLRVCEVLAKAQERKDVSLGHIASAKEEVHRGLLEPLELQWTLDQCELITGDIICVSPLPYLSVDAYWRSVFESGENSDVSLEVDDGLKFPVHSLVLHRLPYFASLLSGRFHESLSSSPVVVIHDVPSPEMRTLLLYVYCGVETVRTRKLTPRLLYAATMFGASELASAIQERLIAWCIEYHPASKRYAGTSDATVCPVEVALAAEAHSLTKLSAEALAAICRNFEAVATGEAFRRWANRV